MANCFSANHIAEDHLRTDMTCNIEEPQQKKMERSVKDYGGGGGGGGREWVVLKLILLDPIPHP